MSDVERCPVCNWPMADSLEQGCIPGNCSFRPLQQALGSRDPFTIPSTAEVRDGVRQRVVALETQFAAAAQERDRLRALAYRILGECADKFHASEQWLKVRQQEVRGE